MFWTAGQSKKGRMRSHMHQRRKHLYKMTQILPTKLIMLQILELHNLKSIIQRETDHSRPSLKRFLAGFSPSTLAAPETIYLTPGAHKSYPASVRWKLPLQRSSAQNRPIRFFYNNILLFHIHHRCRCSQKHRDYILLFGGTSNALFKTRKFLLRISLRFRFLIFKELPWTLSIRLTINHKRIRFYLPNHNLPVLVSNKNLSSWTSQTSYSEQLHRPQR